MRTNVIEAIRRRAIQEETRTDFTKFGCPELAAPASLEIIEAAERVLGFTLWPDHSQVLLEIGNGGFGPGDGLLGLPGGRLDDDGNSLLDVTKMLLMEEKAPLVVICDWGCGCWSCIDCTTGEMMICDEYGLKKQDVQFGDWLEQWANGVALSPGALIT
jgi:hypothetical protein